MKDPEMFVDVPSCKTSPGMFPEWFLGRRSLSLLRAMKKSDLFLFKDISKSGLWIPALERSGRG